MEYQLQDQIVSNIAIDLMGANESIDILVDSDAYYVDFLAEDPFLITDQRLFQRIIYAGFEPKYIKSVIAEIGLDERKIRVNKQSTSLTIIIIDKKIGYLIKGNKESPAFDAFPVLKTTNSNTINEYLNHFDHLWSYSTGSILYENLSNIFATENESNIIVATNDFHDRLMYEIKKDPSIIHKLGSYQFEQFVEILLKKQGYETTLTPERKDGGKDILARFKTPDGYNCLCLVECKRYAPDNPVGVLWVRALYGVLEQHNANLGMIVTSSRFTAGAEKLGKELDWKINLRDYRDINKWLKNI